MCWDKKEVNREVNKGVSSQTNGKDSIHQPIGRSVLNAVKSEYFSDDTLERIEKTQRFVRFDW